MGCCYEHREVRPSSDFVSLTELSMDLNQIPLKQFHTELKLLNPKTITPIIVGKAFENRRFGQNLASNPQCTQRKVLSHQIFKHRSGKLDWHRVFLLGVLYCRGTAKQRCDFLIKIFDEDGNEVIQRKMLESILQIIVSTAAVVLPGFARGETVEQVRHADFTRAQKMVTELLEGLIGEEPWIHCDQLRWNLSRKFHFLLDPPVLRSKYALLEVELSDIGLEVKRSETFSRTQSV